MPTLKITARINDREFRRTLQRLERAGTDLQTVFADIGEYGLLSIEDRFSHQIGPDGRPWADLHPQTRAQKRHPKILTESGRLRGSYIYRAGSDQVEIGTNVRYAAIHQFGGQTRPHMIQARNKKALFWAGASHPVRAVHHPGSRIPARPVLGISNTDEREVLAIVQDHYRRVISG